MDRTIPHRDLIKKDKVKYLGDAVYMYTEFDRAFICISNGILAEHIIVLEPNVLKNVKEYIEEFFNGV